MKNIKLSRLIILLVVALFVSCDDFLEITPEGKLSELGFYQEEQDAEQTVIAIYDAIFTATWPISPAVVLNVMASNRSDESVPNNCDWLGIDNRPDVAEFNIYADNDYANQYWKWCFAGIGRANAAIKGINLVPLENYSSELKKTQLLAESRLLRAYFYLHLVKNFGGVPILEQSVSAGNTNIPRDSKTDVFDFIHKDLKFAIDWLPLKDKTIPGRATKGLASYLMVQSLIFEAGSTPNHENWQLAYDYANKFVNGEYASEYKLIDTYGNIWKQGFDFNDEIIFEWVVMEDFDQGNNWFIASFIQQKVIDYNKQGNPVVVGSWGWGHNGATKALVDAFETNEDWGDPQPWEDPRLKVSVWREGEILAIGASDKDNVNDSLEIYLGTDYAPTGYAVKKYELTREPASFYPDLNPKIYRFSDLILLHAEAAWHIGNFIESRNSLNKIRQRARQGLPNNVLPDITVGGQELLEAIWHERNVELCFEHHRFYDLVRTDRATEVLQAMGKNFIKEKHELLPIPQSEIDIAPELEQNPGY